MTLSCKHLFIPIFLVCCLIILPVSVVFAEIKTETVTVVGMAAIHSDKSMSRDSAINDALRKAVEQTVGLLLSSETIVENSALVRDSIYSKTQGYIKQYKILNESEKDGGYLVTILASVGVSDLKNDLGALGLLHTRAGKPRILLMIAERHDGTDKPVYWWSGDSTAVSASETAMKEEFLGKEFNVVDMSLTVARPGLDKISKQADISETVARDAGRMTGAEIVIKGIATAKEAVGAASGSPVGSYSADTTASAIRVDNGQLIASARGVGVSRHIAKNMGINSALVLSGKDAAKKLMEQIIAKWSNEASGVLQTQITIRKLSGLNDLSKIKNLISDRVRGYQNIVQRSYSDGIALLDVSARSTAQEIAEALTAAENPEISLQITGVTANTLEIVVNSPK